jgi:hypothetical protein
MKVIKSKVPYLIVLVFFFLIVVTDSFVWSEKVEPMVVEVETPEETTNATPNSFLKFVLNDGEE